MARRFLPVILPGALLFAAAAALSGTRSGWGPTRVLRGAIGIAFVFLLATQYTRAAKPVLPHVEYAGVIAKLEALSAQVGDRDLLVVESRNASDTHVLALPLAYIYARNVLVLNSPRPDKTAFAGFLDWARTRYDRVLFMGGGGTDLLSPAWGATPIASERFQIPEYDAPADAYPRLVRQKEFDYSLYELTRPDARRRDGSLRPGRRRQRRPARRSVLTPRNGLEGRSIPLVPRRGRRSRSPASAREQPRDRPLDERRREAAGRGPRADVTVALDTDRFWARCA